MHVAVLSQYSGLCVHVTGDAAIFPTLSQQPTKLDCLPHSAAPHLDRFLDTSTTRSIPLPELDIACLDYTHKVISLVVGSREGGCRYSFFCQFFRLVSNLLLNIDSTSFWP